VLRWVPQGTHHWEKFVTPREFEEMLEAASLDPVARTGFVYEPLRDRWRESRDMAINYMMAAVRRPS
jgi:2-polyprenyl-6-hydroxyphenyl methylase/3-demethylubiquinone-9 3-methyltransferase